MAIEGVDYAGSHPDPVELYAAGRRFACRYGGPGGDWKHLTPDEAAALSAAGVAIVANAEGSASGLLAGWSAGRDWAQLAEAHFARCGMPKGRPIYLSVDFDVTSGQWPAVADALRGAASVIGAARVGVYGGRRAIEWARRDGVAKWFWQTYAWSGGVWVPGNHIEQYRNGVSLAGATLDLDRALTADFGQWTTGDDMALIEQRDWDHARWRIYDALVAGNESAAGPSDLVGQAIYLPRTLNKLVAAAAADETRDKATLAAIQALAAGGGPDAAPILAAIKAEGEASRALLTQQHQEEMAALQRAHDAEVAGLRAELERLTGADPQ